MARFNKPSKRQFQRVFRRRQREAAVLGEQADKHIERLLIKRFDRLVSVRRFVALWVLLFVILFFVMVIQLRALSPYYQTLRPVAGGLYSEGLVGAFTNANPLYATGAADTAVSRLVFSGLFKYDSDNKLVGDLAKNWSLDRSQTGYTVNLRHDISWHDGQPFSANDVVYTYQLIQKVEAQSSLYSSWKDITVNKINNYAVHFSLPNPLSSFPYALTNGIVPKHLLKEISPSQMRSAAFNTAPVGTGPFSWKSLEIAGASSSDRQQRISLAAFKDYWPQRPSLDGFSLIAFSDEQSLIQAFKKKQVNAISGLDTVPEELANDQKVKVYNTPLSGEVMAFFNNSRPILDDKNIRRALVSAIDRRLIKDLLPYPVKPADEPLLRDQAAYNPAARELPYNFAYAKKLLDQAGWHKSHGGQRLKNHQPLELNLSSQNTAQYTVVAQFLQRQWDRLGVKVNVNYYNADDLQSDIIAGHSYDILLYGISIGVDPDVFAYWDSSQASPDSQGHLNLSEYKSSEADQALEAARTRSSPNLRALKYKVFLTTWAHDAPALALYQPNVIYISRGEVFGFSRKAANSSADRFYNVSNWMVRQQHQNL